MAYPYRILTYFRHKISAKNTYGFGIHSPFLFNFTQSVICEQYPYYCFSTIEKSRERFISNRQKLFVEDMGTGSSQYRRVCDIAHKSLKSKQYGQLLFRIAVAIRAQNILELGTSLGITTCYLAATNSKATCTTIEGSPNLAKLAQENFNSMGYDNIRLMQGNIDEILPLILKDEKPFDIIFFDANHTREATLKYFEMCSKNRTEHSIFVFDDIHYSQEMHKAWKEIQQHSQVTATIDLYEMGIVFFDRNFQKKCYKMRF